MWSSLFLQIPPRPSSSKLATDWSPACDWVRLTCSLNCKIDWLDFKRFIHVYSPTFDLNSPLPARTFSCFLFSNFPLRRLAFVASKRIFGTLRIVEEGVDAVELGRSTSDELSMNEWCWYGGFMGTSQIDFTDNWRQHTNSNDGRIPTMSKEIPRFLKLYGIYNFSEGLYCSVDAYRSCVMDFSAQILKLFTAAFVGSGLFLFKLLEHL